MQSTRFIKEKSFHNGSILEQGPGVSVAAVAALPGADTCLWCLSETLGRIHGWRLRLRCSCVERVSASTCPQSGRGLISAPTGSPIAFEQEVNRYSCAISVLPQTRGTGCPSPASKRCELGVAFSCLLIPADGLIQVHLF